MGGSGLIVVVIVAAWALFLVPQWMHRRASAAAHLADRVPEASVSDDEAAQGGSEQSVEGGQAERSRFGRRQLARRHRDAPTPRRWSLSALPSLHLPPRWRRRPTQPQPKEADVPPSHPRSAAARRRRVVSGLALITLLAALAVAVGSLLSLPVPGWIVALPGGLLVAYLVLLAVLRPGAPSHEQWPAAPASVDGPVEGSGRGADDRGRLQATDQVPGRATVPSSSRASGPDLVASGALAVASGDVEHQAPEVAGPETAADGSTWTPVPLPTPTYVTAPRARRVVRTIDLSNPGSWTSESPAAAAVTTAASPASAEAAPADGAGSSFADGDDEYEVEHRRAVGD